MYFMQSENENSASFCEARIYFPVKLPENMQRCEVPCDLPSMKCERGIALQLSVSRKRRQRLFDDMRGKM